MKTNFPQSRVSLNPIGLEVDDCWYPPVAYTSYLPQEKFYRGIAECGIHLYCFPAYLAGRGINIHSGIGPFRNGVWQDDGEYDLSDIEHDLQLILSADPEARIIMRLHLDAPEWWEKKYPQGCCQLRNGETLRQSFFSSLWQESAGRALEDIVLWLGQSPYARHMAGVHIAAGGTEEWMFHSYGPFADENPARREAFMEFLHRKYGSQDATDSAWTANGQRESIPVIDALHALEAPAEKRWRDPVKDAAVLDACRFHSTALVGAIMHFCKIVKRASAGRLLTGVFYGYHFYVSDVRKGHTALSELLRCPELDYLASPNKYYRREPGRDWTPMAATDSVLLHGKIWMAENDTRTALTRPLAETAPTICPEGQYCDGLWKGPDSLYISAQLLRTNAARMLTHGYGGWWFDMWGGWYDHPQLLAEITAAQEIWQERPPRLAFDSVPADTLCLFTDERIAEYDASFGTLCNIFGGNSEALMACGRPWRLYLRNDLPHLDLSQTRCVWMLDSLELTAKEEEKLRNCARGGALVLHTSTDQTRKFAEPEERWTEIGSTALEPDRLRELLDEAGIHCYIKTKDILYVGGGYLAVHAATAGEKEICLPRKFKTEQLLPERTVPQQGCLIRQTMRTHETLLLRLTEA